MSRSASSRRACPSRDRRARRRHAGAGQARRFRPAQAARAFRRPAPARGAGAFAGQAAARAVARRADGGARQEAARRDAVRADGTAAPARADFHHRHPRSERSDDGGRPDRGDGPRPAHAGRRRRPKSTSGRIRAGSRTSSATSICSRAASATMARASKARRWAGCALPPRSMPNRARRFGWRCGRRKCASRRTEPRGGSATTASPQRFVDIGYLGDLSIYKMRIGDGAPVKAAIANTGRLAERAIGWDDEVWLSFPAGIGDRADAMKVR